VYWLKIYFSDYRYKYRVCSLSFAEETTEALLSAGLNVLAIYDGKAILLPDNYSFNLLSQEKDKLDLLCESDVLEISDNGIAFIYYSANANDNYIAVTSRCNSNCIMCPSGGSLDNHEQDKITALMEIAKHIPRTAKFLTITGGEPFLLKKEIFLLFDYLKSNFPDTRFLVLTNGRVFCSPEYVESFGCTLPKNCTVGIPIHGDESTLHDYLAQANGSFEQTCVGIRNLLSHHINVEIRIVVNALNCDRMLKLADFIIKNFMGIKVVNFIAMEMLGSAALNSDRLWIPYPDAFNKIKTAIEVLISKQIDVGLYNFPLCAVEQGYWSLCANSISDYKISYSDDECRDCTVADICGGVFSGSIRFAKKDLKRVL
jgi:His-Xaa-Ser system radical SAM maturase HxsC